MTATNPRFELERLFLLSLVENGELPVTGDNIGQINQAKANGYVEPVHAGPFVRYKINGAGLERLEELGDM